MPFFQDLSMTQWRHLMRLIYLFFPHMRKMKGWLRHGENCLNAKNDAEFRKHIEMLIENKEMRLKLGQGAKALAESKSIDILSRNAGDIYKKLLNWDIK